MNRKGSATPNILCIIPLGLLVLWLISIFTSKVTQAIHQENTMAPTTPAKPDTCMQYLERAREGMLAAQKMMREAEEKHYNLTEGITANASLSSMNSSYYLACREMQKNR